MKKFKVIETIYFEQVDEWEFEAKSKKELKENLKDPYFMTSGFKQNGVQSEVRRINKII